MVDIELQRQLQHPDEDHSSNDVVNVEDVNWRGGEERGEGVGGGKR